MVKRMPHRDLAYFRDDQIVFLVTHPENLTGKNLEDFQTEMSPFIKTRPIADLPRAFSFPPTMVSDPEQGLSALHKLDLDAVDKDLENRRKELQTLKNLLIDRDWKGGPDELEESKKSWQKDKDWQERLLVEVDRRERLLDESQTLAVDHPKLFDTPYSVLLCDLNVPPPTDKPEPLLGTIQSLRSILSESSVKERTFGGMKVEDASPNWLMSVSSQGGATGGPGALPMPFHPSRDGEPLYGFSQLREELINHGLYDAERQGENVDVAILDTLPCDHELVLALKEWPNHHLVQDLLGPSGKLTPYHATHKALKRMASTSVNQHDYPMTNHGLFAAAIVNSIVPKAQIHLVEVLNEFGVGDLASLAEGLSLVYNQIRDPNSRRRLVVNCSWMLELPLSDLHCIASEEDEEYEFEQAILKYVKDDKDHALHLRDICNQLALAGSQVVAAAGNDKLYAKKIRERKLLKLQKLQKLTNVEDINLLLDYLLEHIKGGAPEARYPAAFTSVIGVGALPKGKKRDLNAGEKYESSNYSNLGDKPSGEAVMTLGGEEGIDNHQKNRGILGLYLGNKFPSVQRDPMPDHPHKREIKMEEVEKDNPLAWWAGTSFAAPIVTGAIAAALGTKRNTQEAFAELKNAGIIAQMGTAAEEDVMYVEQGPPPV